MKKPYHSKEWLWEKYWGKKESIEQIAKEARVHRETIRKCMVKYGVLRRTRSEAEVNKRSMPNLFPSEDLAYVLGVWKGDGCIYSNPKFGEYRFILNQTREKFAEAVECSLRKIGLNSRTRIVRVKKRSPRQKEVYYRTIVNSKLFCDWCSGLSLPKIREIIFGRKELERAFIRGFFEAEGTNRLSRPGGRHEWSISFSNTNLDLLLLAKEFLKNLGFDFRLLRDGRPLKKNWNPLFMLQRSSHDVSARFINEIRPCVKDEDYSGCFVRRLESWNAEKVIQKIRELALLLNRTPPSDKASYKLVHAAQKYFGKWNSAKRAAGLEICKFSRFK